MVKFCIYHGFEGGYSYSNMTNYFKMNNDCKFYCKTVVVREPIIRSYQVMLILSVKYFVI